MLNTPEELAKYDPAVDCLLDRILDEYGIIAAGWSATYDQALRSAVERVTTRRFSSWWIEPVQISEHGQRLIDLRSIRTVRATADDFFPAVADAVEPLAQIDAPAPQTTAIAVASAKRSLSGGGDRIRLHDLIKAELTRVSSAPQVARDSFPDLGTEEYGADVGRLEGTMESLLAVVATVSYWGDDATDDWWVPAIVPLCRTFGQPAGRRLDSVH